MRLVYYLEQLKTSTLKSILSEHGVETNEKSPVKLMDQLAKLLCDLHYLQNLYKTMSTEEKGVLQHFIIHRPGQLLSIRTLNHHTGLISRGQFEKGLLLLHRKGILFRLRKSYGDMGYVIPHDVFQVWHQVLISKK
ncbi:hypothetical protein [Tepidibacillus marianensis]|uniref:hypothetical protein n=1 Tax=Tepidibacillus marianensis TaxID=3131995 RepID=UPI0030CB2ACC